MAKQTPESGGGFEPGRYTERYIEFTSRDANTGEPIFKVHQTKHGMWTVAHYKTFNADDEDGPRGSVEPGDVGLLVHAFGGDPGKLPVGDDLRALSAAERLISEAEKDVRVTVGDSGYISFVDGMSLPGGEYLFTTKNIRNWRDGQWGRFAPIDLAVESYADGSPCPLRGAKASVRLTEAAMKLLYAVAPTTTTALLGEPNETLERLGQMAMEENENRFIYGKVAKAKEDSKRPTLRKETLKAVPLGETASQAPAGEEKLEPDYMQHLYTAIADGTKADFDGAKAFDTAGKPTEEGKMWCRAHFVDIVKSHQTVTGHEISNKFVEMSQDDVVVLLTGVGRGDLVTKMTGAIDEEDEGGWG